MPKPPPNRFSFTRERLAKLPAPATGRTTYHDDKTPGLILRVTANGVKSFTWYRKINGEPVRLLLGTFPAISVEEARTLAKEKAHEQANGRDPRADRRTRQQELTMGDLIAHWLEYAKAHKRSWAEDVRMCDKYVAPWAKRKLSAIRKTDVQAMHLRLAKDSGKYTANRAHELIRAMYNRAKDIGYEGENPALGIKRFAEEKRDRFLHANELGAFFTALQAEPNPMIQHFFLLLLLTGGRRSNVQAMRWDEIDFSTALWRIPETKSGKPVVVPLTTAALSVIHARREANGNNEWVFPSKGKTGHIVEPTNAWQRIITRAGLVDVRPHDLRRSLGSWMAITGAGLPIVGKMLGHTQANTTMIYARLSVDPVRAAAEAATAAMLQAGGVKLLEAHSEPEKEGQGDEANS